MHAIERMNEQSIAWNGNICMHAHPAQHAFHGLRTLFRHNTRAGTLQPATSCCPTTAAISRLCQAHSFSVRVHATSRPVTGHNVPISGRCSAAGDASDC